jgi:hypothetical protein
MEVSFVVEGAALQMLRPDSGTAEDGLLETFDTSRARIHEVAEKVYSRGKKRRFAYDLAVTDF